MFQFKTIKKIFFIIIVFCFVSSPSYSIEKNTLVKNISLNKNILFSDLLNKFDVLLNNINDERKQFENLSTYESRIYKNENIFKSFLENKYFVNITPDYISLDWENSILNVRTYFPIEIIRKRGGPYINNILKAIFSVEPSLVREIYLFKQYINMDLYFHLDRKGRIVVDSYAIKYLKKIIFKE